MTDDSRPDIREIRAVGIPVTDQDAALKFYAETLGFEVRVDTPVPQLGGRWIMLAPPGSEVMIALVAEHDGVPAGVETGIRFHTPDAAATHAALQDRGVEVGELLRWPGVPAMFEVRDRDGNRFEIVE
jgi:catechol 2,3-dioxygenase-like lactoylglutathione lyase family enzyme